jgi:hypothetical protein
LISLEVDDSNLLELFYGLKSLRKIKISLQSYIINKINEIFDPSKIFELDIGEVRSEEELLCMFNEVDIKLILPKMKSLTSLALPLYDNEYLDYIYTECRSLHTLKF